MVGVLRDDWREVERLAKLGRRLNFKLALEYDIVVMTRSEVVGERVRVSGEDIVDLFQLPAESAIVTDLTMPRGMSFDFKSVFTYVIYVHESVCTPVEFLCILAHEASHIVDYIEANAGAKFCTEVRSYVTEDVFSKIAEILDINCLTKI